jgi:hypothetical protein
MLGTPSRSSRQPTSANQIVRNTLIFNNLCIDSLSISMVNIACEARHGASKTASVIEP